MTAAAVIRFMAAADTAIARMSVMDISPTAATHFPCMAPGLQMPGQILIAEEHKECCQLFKSFLQRCGYEVSTVNDGSSCMEAILRNGTPDVLVISWELPWSESEGALDWFGDHRLNDLEVVALTARMDTDYPQQELSHLNFSWVQRPFRLLELLEAVQSRERVPMAS